MTLLREWRYRRAQKRLRDTESVLAYLGVPPTSPDGRAFWDWLLREREKWLRKAHDLGG